MKPSKALSFARKLRKNQTPAEKIFWEKVRNKRFHNFKFYRQHRVKYLIDSRQYRYFIADFYCHHIKLIIEIDGPIHQKKVAFDKQRTDILNAMGYHLIRFTNEQVLEDWKAISKEIFEILGNSPGPS